MDEAPAMPGARSATISWILLAGVAALALLSATYVGLTPAGDQTDLTDRTWQEFAAQNSEVASLFSMQLSLVGVLGAAFALAMLVVILIPYRRGVRWAWYALWLVPATFGAIAARMLVDQYAVGFYYAGLAAVALIGLLIPIGKFMGR